MAAGFASDRSSAQTVDGQEPSAEWCETAEDCFMAAVWPQERMGNTLTEEQGVALKLERLRRLMERFPDSPWAKRARLLVGVLLIQRDPAQARADLRAVQQEFPILQDYVWYWTGEALAALGEAQEAALAFESVFQSVPESSLRPQAALRATEAWYQASRCPETIAWAKKALAFPVNEKDPTSARMWFRLADCYTRTNQASEAREALIKIWVKFPSTEEAKQVALLLAQGDGGREPWVPKPEDVYARAQALLGQALHAEAIEELKRFLAQNPPPALASEAKLKLGIAQVRLKRYDQARETFQELAQGRTAQASDAIVWLARVYLRQGLGDKLLALSRTIAKRPLSAEQKGLINLFVGMWLEDQAQFEEAITQYGLVAKMGDPASQRLEARWRQGWVLYRVGQYRSALRVWQPMVEQPNSEWEPQVLYWMGRASELIGNPQAKELFESLCQRYPYTYYCQLARERLGPSANKTVVDHREAECGDRRTTVTPLPTAGQSDSITRSRRGQWGTEQDSAYRRAAELHMLGLEQEAARELTQLAELYATNNDVDSLASVAVSLNGVGAYHDALRLVRTKFREQLERRGGSLVNEALWEVAYPVGLMPTITRQNVAGVDPFLVAAIIREESQYDRRAVSRVGAIGLMQIMPATAKEVAQRHGFAAVTRDDLFDEETNVRIGVRYMEHLLARFYGNLVHAIAAYNAGPLVVQSWVVAYRGRSDDEFVELIPFQETRHYVKRVLRSYKEYRRLNGL
jgi:soluble lytic murein transglycosylase